MQIGYILLGICIAVIADAVFEFLGHGMGKVVEKFSISPLRRFWKPFLVDGGSIIIPPYPKNRSEFSVKNGTGYNDCIASGEIRKFFAFLGKDIQVKDEISKSDYYQNFIAIGGPISNPAFKDIEQKVKSPFIFKGNDIYYTTGEEYQIYPLNKNYHYGLLYLLRKSKNLWVENQTVILIAGCHGPDTRKLAEILTRRECIQLLNKRIKDKKYTSAVFIIKCLKEGYKYTPQEEIIENDKSLQFV